MVPSREKIWKILDPEFGNDASKSAITVRVSCGLKIAGALFMANLAQCM